MKKTLNVTAIKNELKGGSLFFSRSGEQKIAKTNPNSRTPERVNERTAEQANARTADDPNERAGERPNTRTSERTNKRTPERANGRTTPEKSPQRPITRHSFQFYKDQITQLKRLRAQKELQGTDCHLSDLVRQAIDEFLARNKQ